MFFFGLSRSLPAIVSTIKGLPFSSDPFTFSNLSVDQTFAMTLLLTLFLVIGYGFPGTMITASMVPGQSSSGLTLSSHPANSRYSVCNELLGIFEICYGLP